MCRGLMVEVVIVLDIGRFAVFCEVVYRLQDLGSLSSREMSLARLKCW